MELRRRATIISGVIVVLHGCATPTGNMDASTTSSAEATNVAAICAAVGLVGFGACTLLSDGSRGRKVGTGLACAAAAVIGCYVLNSYKAEQTRTAQEVEADYRRTNRQLPENPTLVAYSTDLNPKGSIARGKEIVAKSAIRVVPGRSQGPIKVEEEASVVDAGGEVWGNPVRKQSNANGEAGEFRTTFTIPVHEKMSQGIYEIRKKVFINGSETRTNQTSKFQVVHGPEGTLIATLFQ